MRYVIVDQDGAGRDYFDDRSVLEAELRQVQREDPDLLRDLLVTTYDDTGRRVRSDRAEDVLPLMQTQVVMSSELVTTAGAANSSELLQPA